MPICPATLECQEYQGFYHADPLFCVGSSSIDIRYNYAMTETIENKMQGISEIQIVTIDLQDRPAWYKEKVYPPNKVGSCFYVYLILFFF